MMFILCYKYGMKTKQIIAMGGGGFSMEPDNLLLDEYVLAQTGKPKPKICFLPTASGESESYIVNFYKAFSTLPAVPSYFSFFNPHTRDLEDFFLDQDVIYVGGGNTKSMLGLWREWQVDKILQKAYREGVVLAGISAGAICWFEESLTDSLPGSLTVLPCLGFLPGSCVPHYDSEAERRPSYYKMIEENAIQPGYGVENSAALHFIDGKLYQTVCSVPGKQAYFVDMDGEQVTETPLETHFLGK